MVDPAIVIIQDPEMGGDHGLRIRSVVAAMTAEAAVMAVCHRREWTMDGVWAAILFNSADDYRSLTDLRRAGRPVIYCPGPGPSVDGHFTQGVLHDANHRVGTRLKMQAASAIQVDSFVQAAATAAHYCLPGPWLVLPPAVTAPHPDGGDADVPAGGVCWVVGRGDEWAADLQKRGLDARSMGTGEAAQRAAQGQAPAACLWFAEESYANPLLDVIAAGVPTAAVGRGLVDDPGGVLAGWFVEDDDALTALDRVLEWTTGRRRAARNAAQGATWTGWARAVLAALRQLRCSPAAAWGLGTVLPAPGDG